MAKSNPKPKSKTKKGLGTRNDDRHCGKAAKKHPGVSPKAHPGKTCGGYSPARVAARARRPAKITK